MSLLAERVIHNERQRHGNAYRSGHARPGGSRNSIFEQSKTLARHPLDRRFQCGFDPQNVSIREYTAHIRTCRHEECQARCDRWHDLAEYFRRREGL